MAKYQRPALNTSDFNMREIAKQMLLLEDHLSDDEKFCEDCIRKHLLMIEALAEESVALEPSGTWVVESRRLADLARHVIVDFSDGVSKADLATRVRLVRKKLVANVYDPRAGMVTRPLIPGNF